MATATAPPPTAGRYVIDGDELCFVPRFPFVEETSYAVVVDGQLVAEVVRPGARGPATTQVVDVRPTARVVPRNLLRFYLTFSAPMSEGLAVANVRLEDEEGEELTHALLRTEEELWDRERRRLTVLLDPARIKRGLVAHDALGYPLRVGTGFRLVVDDALLDATGTPLQGGAVRGFLVGDDERRIVDPRTWEVSRPGVGSREPVVVEFHRPLDHGLLSRCLRVVDARGHRIRGIGTVGAEEGSWRFAPEQPWADRGHELLIDPRLEDLAGNSLVRVFDRDLSELTHHPEVSVDDGVVVGFRPGPDRAQ